MPLRHCRAYLQAIDGKPLVTHPCPAPAGERHREGVLQSLSHHAEDWTLQVRREKAIYHTLNKLSIDTSRKVGSGWAQGLPGRAVRSVQALTACSAAQAL